MQGAQLCLKRGAEVGPPWRHWEGKKKVRGQAKGPEGKIQAEDMPSHPRDQPGGPGLE